MNEYNFEQFLKYNIKIGIENKHYFFDSNKKVIKSVETSRDKKEYEIVKDLSLLDFDKCYLVLDNNDFSYHVLLKDEIEVWNMDLSTLHFTLKIDMASAIAIPLAISYFDKGYTDGIKEGKEQKISEIKSVLNL